MRANSAKHMLWRADVKRRILNTLAHVSEPQTTGDLFLLVRESHTVISKYLAELRDEGLVRSEMRTAHTKIYNGSQFIHEATHWSLNHQPASTRKQVKK